MITKEVNEKDDKRKAILLCLTLAALSVKNILFIVPAILSVQTYVNVIVVTLVVMAFTYDFIKNVRRQDKYVLFLILVFSLFCLLQLLFYENNRKIFLETIPNIVVYGIIPFYYVTGINNYELLLRQLKKVAVMIIWAAFIGMIEAVAIGSSYDYHMSYGNFTTIGVAIIEYWVLKEKKIGDIILFITGIAELLICGSRAAFAVPVCLLVLYFLAVNKVKTNKGRIGLLVIIITIIIAIVRIKDIIDGLNILLENLGISSRNVYLLANGEFFFSQSRLNIFHLCMDIFVDHPFFGIGAEGLQGMGYTDLTPHNMYIELLLYYGCIVGGFLIVALIAMWIHGIVYKPGSQLQILIVIWFSLYASRSLTGVGVLTNNNFWILLALCIKSLRIHFQGNEHVIIEEGNSRYEKNN